MTPTLSIGAGIGNPVNRLIAYTPQNRQGKHDGDEFAREAHALAKRHGGELLELPEWPKLRRRALARTCAALAGENLGHFAFFGHGMPPSLVHFYSSKNVGEMADALALCMSPGCTITLYACLAGKTFAPLLCGELQRRGVSGARVLSHYTAGHCCRNPDVTISITEDHTRYLVSRKSDLWKPWRDALKGDFRFDFPMMSKDEIESYLGSEDQTVQLRRSVNPLAAPTWRERE
jgi:hypothetical protein